MRSTEAHPRRSVLLIIAAAAGLLAACAAPQPVTLTPTLAPSATTAPTATATVTLTPSATPIPLSAICTPLAEHAIGDLLSLYLTQPFIPPQGANKETGHHGVDFAYYRGGPTGGHINGTPVQSVLDGDVAGLGYNPVYGNYLIVETRFARLLSPVTELYGLAANESLYLLYAHMQEPAPFVLDEPLDCGQVVGLVGGTGDPFFVTDPHLHLETRVGPAGFRLGPMSFYDTQASEEQKQNYMLWRSSDTFRLNDPLLLLGYAVDHP